MYWISLWCLFTEVAPGFSKRGSVVSWCHLPNLSYLQIKNSVIAIKVQISGNIFVICLPHLLLRGTRCTTRNETSNAAQCAVGQRMIDIKYQSTESGIFNQCGPGSFSQNRGNRKLFVEVKLPSWECKVPVASLPKFGIIVKQIVFYG